LTPSELNEVGLKAALRLGADEAILLSSAGNEQMVRFANDSLTVAKKTEESDVSIYLAKNGRRIVGGSSNTDGRRRSTRPCPRTG
jgi:predicted Zn-dependent protease